MAAAHRHGTSWWSFEPGTADRTKFALASPFFTLDLLAGGAAQANADSAAKRCGKCHSMDKKGNGPPYNAIAAKFKGDEAAAVKATLDPKGDHPEVKAKPDEVQAIVQWVLSQ